MQRYRKIACVCTVGLAVTACATVAPAPSPSSASADVAQPFDTTWANLISFLSEHDIQIRTIEKASGVVYARLETRYHLPYVGITSNAALRSGDPSGAWANCGGVGTPVSRATDVNAFVEHLSDTRSRVKVTVNVAEVQDVPGLLFGSTVQTVSCESTGQLEHAILAIAEQPRPAN